MSPPSVCQMCAPALGTFRHAGQDERLYARLVALPWRLPLMQAPLGPAATPELVSAVSMAGALGTLAASWTPQTNPAKRFGGSDIELMAMYAGMSARSVEQAEPAATIVSRLAGRP